MCLLFWPWFSRCISCVGQFRRSRVKEQNCGFVHLRVEGRCVMRILFHLFVSIMVIGVPAVGLAQFSDRGDHVEVKKGTRLCSGKAVDGIRGTLNQRPIFWRVTSSMRVNGTQTVSAVV